MSARHRPYVLAALIAFCLFAPVVGTATADTQEASSYDLTLHDIAVRDSLIAAQEALLNVYRCRFDIDTQVVPGGCVEGIPAQDAPETGAFEGTPWQQDVDVRDSLIANQEALLNTYRCQFEIDIHMVPSGCAKEPSPANAFTAVSASLSHSCGLRTNGTIECWGSNALQLHRLLR